MSDRLHSPVSRIFLVTLSSVLLILSPVPEISAHDSLRLTQSQLAAGRSSANSTRTTSGGATAVFFNPATYPSAGIFGTSVAVGDFNGDGKTDLVVANQCYNTTCTTGGLSVLLGNGDGTFQPAQSYASGGYETYAVAVGDLTGNGNLDLVVANGCQSATQCGSGVVSVLLGNGDGTFQAAQSFASGGITPVAVAIADFNGDGNEDIAVANQCETSSCSNGGLGVLLGNGEGTFQNAVSYSSGGVTAVALAVGDFNGDENQDIVVANQCQTASNCDGNVGVLLGNGNGTFKTPRSYASRGYRAVSVATADFNQDGKLDLVVANQCLSSANCNNGGAGVLLGNGDGTFQTGKSFTSGGTDTAAVIVSTLKANGPADLILVNRCELSAVCTYGSVSVLLGNGNGTFGSASNYLSDGVFADAVATADFNGDLKADLVVVNNCASDSSCGGSVTVLLGNGNGTLQAPPRYVSGGYDSVSVAVGDLNGDGIPDLAVANFCSTNNCSSGNNGLLQIFLGNGNGTFRKANSYPTLGFRSSSVAIADLNGDGNADVVVANQCSSSDCGSGGIVSVFLGVGNGTLQPAQLYPSGGVTSLAVTIADFNNDGVPDIAVANQCQDSTCVNGSVGVLLGNGDGTFQPAQNFAAGAYETDAVATGDLNNDGNLDLVLASQCQDSTCQNGAVSVLLGNGDGTFQSAQTYSTAAAQADSVAVADLNGDGNADLVVADLCTGPGNCSNGVVSSLMGMGDGTFRTARPFSSGGQYAYFLAAADFDGDGNVDVVVANSDGTFLLVGNGDETFQTAVPYCPNGVFVAEGDFNGDYRPDIVVAGGPDSTFTILMNVVDGYRLPTTTALNSSPNPSSVHQSVLITANVSTQFGGPPTGTVTFESGTTTLGTAALNNGQATLQYTFTSQSTYALTAEYQGDTNYLPSNSAVLKQPVYKAPTTTQVVSSLNPSQNGQTVTFTATVTGQYGGTPTGSVTFQNGSTVLAQVPLTNGEAQYSTSALSTGTHFIFVQYSGDANFEKSHGQVTQKVE